jgi:hypothetical protein
MAFPLNSNATLTEGAEELLRRIEGPLSSWIGPDSSVFEFTPRFLSAGGWVGRIVCRSKDKGTVVAMLEGWGGTVLSNVQMLSRPKPKMTVRFLPTSKRTLHDIELEGPGFLERTV